MASLFGIDCSVVGGNTGLANCDTEIGRIIGLMAVRRNTGLSLLNLQTSLYSQLETMAQNNDPNLRLYPIGEFQVTAANDQDRTQATAAGTGNTKTLRDAKIGWTWTLWESLCHYTAIQKFNGQERNYDFYMITDENQFIAILRNNQAQGIRFSDFYVSPYNPKGDDTAPNGTISVQIANTNEWRNNLIVVQPAEDLTQIQGLLDAQPVNLTADPLPVAGTFKVGVSSGCGGGAGSTNLIDLYESVLEDTDNWVVSNATTNAAITVTSITASADKTYLTFVMPTTSPYVAGQGVRFTLAGVTALTTAGMEGYEGQSVVIPNVV